MSWAIVATVISVAGTAYSSIEQNKALKSQMKQGEMDKKVSASETQTALDEQNKADTILLNQANREALRAKASAKANQANSGLAGVVAERQLNNIDFQESLDINMIKENNRAKLDGITGQGYSNDVQIQSGINMANSQRSSTGAIILKSSLSGLGTYALVKSK